MYCIVHTVLISCITVLYESYGTVMQLIGQIQYGYAENLCKEYYGEKKNTKSLKSAKLILQGRSTARNRLYKHLLIV